MKRIKSRDVRDRDRLRAMRELAIEVYEDAYGTVPESSAEMTQVTAIQSWIIWYMPLAGPLDVPFLAVAWQKWRKK